MIKKFHEYIKEDIKNIISIEEIEDQFLRLKEVFGCDIKIIYLKDFSEKSYEYCDRFRVNIIFHLNRFPEKNLKDVLKSISEEIKQVELRMQKIYNFMHNSRNNSIYLITNRDGMHNLENIISSYQKCLDIISSIGRNNIGNENPSEVEIDKYILKSNARLVVDVDFGMRYKIIRLKENPIIITKNIKKLK